MLSISAIKRKTNDSLNISVEDHLRVMQEEDNQFGLLDDQEKSKRRKSVGQRVSQMLYNSRKSNSEEKHEEKKSETNELHEILAQVRYNLKNFNGSTNPKDYNLDILLDESDVNKKLNFYSSATLN